MHSAIADTNVPNAAPGASLAAASAAGGAQSAATGSLVALSTGSGSRSSLAAAAPPQALKLASALAADIADKPATFANRSAFENHGDYMRLKTSRMKGQYYRRFVENQPGSYIQLEKQLFGGGLIGGMINVNNRNLPSSPTTATGSNVLHGNSNSGDSIIQNHNGGEIESGAKAKPNTGIPPAAPPPTAPPHATHLFENLTFWLTGRTKHLTDLQIRKLIVQNGGTFEPYGMTHVSHIICENLALGNQQWRQLRKNRHKKK
jgi:hypothetical protein